MEMANLSYAIAGWCDLTEVVDPSSCGYRLFVISIASFLFVSLLVNFIFKYSLIRPQSGSFFQLSSSLHLLSAAFNGCLGLIYLGLSLWVLGNSFRSRADAFPLSWCLLVSSQGLVFMFIAFVSSMRVGLLGDVFTRIWSTAAALCVGFISISSVFVIFEKTNVSFKMLVDISSFPGAVLFLISSFKDSTRVGRADDQTINKTLSVPLISETNGGARHGNDFVTPFSNAGFFSKMSFWWLNPLMKKGYQKPLDEKDIPSLGDLDRAKACYSLFLERWNRKKQSKLNNSPSFLWTIVSCHQKEILVSGLFALIKVLTVSAGPLLLKAFIRVASGDAAFKYEGYLLAVGLFLVKFIESLSQRQWYFRGRLIGLRVRSLITALIYQKQFRLSNTEKLMLSSGEIMNYVTVDAYRIGEFPYWFHQTWTTCLQLCIALMILYGAVGAATISALLVVLLTVLCNAPLAKLQNKFQTQLMGAQDVRLKAMSEALVNMKVLKLYAWETHFKKVIEGLRNVEYKWLSAAQLRRAYNTFLFWSSPVLVSAATFLSCYFLGIPLNSSNVFTFVATLRLVQDPVRSIPDVLGVVIQAKVSFTRVVRFLNAPEMKRQCMRKENNVDPLYPISIESSSFSWDGDLTKLTLRNITLKVRCGEKVAICGEVGSGKSTILASILREIPNIGGKIQVSGRIAYVSQSAWIQTGTVRENILFGSQMNTQRYEKTLERCSLVKDIEMLPFGDLTEIGERGVNFSGGQKQRVQLARALYQDADIYLLDDPFSAVDAHTAASLFNECVMGALSSKTVLLVTHQVDFLPAFDSILMISDGEIRHSATYYELLSTSKEFQKLVNAHQETTSYEMNEATTSGRTNVYGREIHDLHEGRLSKNVTSGVDQLIKKEERESGDTGLKPYIQYLSQNKGFMYLSCSVLCHIIFFAGQISQNSWMAANVDNPQVSLLRLISVYLVIGFTTTIVLLGRSILVVALGIQSSKSLFSELLNSLFRAPMSFFDSTPLGRILSRVSVDLSIVDLDVPFSLMFSICASINFCSNVGVVAVITWQVLFVAVPMVYLVFRLQRYYLASANQLMRLNGTTKSVVANHLAESIAGGVTIRAFKEEERFFARTMELIDKNASPFFHNFAASEWLIQRLETMSAVTLSSSAFVMALLPPGTFGSGFVGMALSYGLSMNLSLVGSIQNQCMIANYIISVERINQYMHVPSEAPEVIEDNRPPETWPECGKIELHDLKIRYRPDTPLVLFGITCTFEGGHKIGIVGRTGSGKTTLISALFRLVEPEGGIIVIDGLDIAKIGLHDLRSRFGIIPQDPTLFNGSVRYNLDPLGQHTDREIWEVLDKCHLRDAVLDKENGLESLVVEDGSNWSMGQRQLFCLGRALLQRSRILVLDEATASIDNATDAILQKTIRSEFAECTVITVAHRIPTVMDCTMILGISDGKLVEYDEPAKLMATEGSLFGNLVKEYWSHAANVD